mgnify:FL=1
MKERIEELRKLAEQRLKEIQDMDMLNSFCVKFLGKSGELTALLRGMKDVKPEDRPQIGSFVNDLRNFLEARVAELKKIIEEKVIESKIQREKIDITEPSKNVEIGALHPLEKTFNKVIEICKNMGFEVVTGPEIESDYYNFEALNIPKDHPARDMQDSFYITPNILLRTQTSAGQIRSMEGKQPPIKVVVAGRTFRVDSDATHSPVFHQFEGLVVDKNVSLVDLKSMLDMLLKQLLGEKTQTRFRPSYFPFTEPSVEVDVTCPMCKGKGCTRCKQTGWMELLGAGIVNPKVLENCGIDSSVYSGFAFGIGIDRIAMVINSIPDIRMMYENDIRFLSQNK